MRWALLVAWVLGGSLAAGARAETASDRRAQELLRDPTPVEWAALARFDGLITHDEFEARLLKVYDSAHGLAPYVEDSADRLVVFPGTDHHARPLAVITFLRSPPGFLRGHETFRSPERYRAGPGASRSQPLGGLKIAIEPADIGGRWAKAEDRSVYFAGFGTINEGDLNLVVGKLLTADLTRLGAEVFLVRDRAEPVVGLKPEELLATAAEVAKDRPWMLPEAYRLRIKAAGGHPANPLLLAADLLLTKAIETRARAALVRAQFQPDLTIILQHDASGDSGEGHLAPLNRNIFFVNGAYSPQELAEPEQRFRLLTKLFQNVTPIEIEVAARIADRFKARTGFPPLLYGDSGSTRLVLPKNPYVVARNLAFNREHDGPVVVTEPYFMNEPGTAARLMAGDFAGERVISGKKQASIFREYAETVTEGLLDAYHR